MTSLDRRQPAPVRSGAGPLGALTGLSGAARRALVVVGGLAALTAVAVVLQAFSLARLLADVVGGRAWSPGWLGLLAGAVLARAALAWATQVVAARAAAGAKEELRTSLVDSAVRRGPEWIATRGPAELTALGTRGLDALDAYFAQYLPALVSAAVLPLAVGVVIAVADPTSAVLIAVTVPLIPVFAILVGRYTQAKVAALADTGERMSGKLLELIRALPVLTAFRRAQAQTAVVRQVSDAHRTATMATLRVAFSSAFVLELVAMLSVALVAVGIGLRMAGGDLGLGVGLFVLILAPECYLPLRAAGAAHHASEDGVEAVRRVADLRSEPASGGHALPRGAVRLTELRVRRRDPTPVSCVVRPGEITRLDAPSGAGKSTAIAALLGFVPVDGGRITVGGKDFAGADPVAWRRSVAWVPQRPAFTGGSVADELAIAVPAATAAQVYDVTDDVNASDLLSRRIAQLSTGERQRVAVARALLRLRHGAWLLLLDEPTAHLDADNAAAVMKAVQRAADDGAAVLLATHRSAQAAGDQPVRPARTGPAGGVLRSALLAPTPRLRALITRRGLVAALLGALALACGVALTATSAWLIATASLGPPILTLSVAIVGVRTFGLAKAGLRYAERLAGHDAALRTATSMRERLWRTVVRLGPAGTTELRRADAVQRMVDDVADVRDLTPRVLAPPLIAAGVSLVAVVVQWLILPSAGLALLGAVLVAGVLAPWLAVRLERRATAALADGNRALSAGMLSLFDAAPDLIAFGADARARADLAARDAELTARARRQAFGAGAGAGLIVLATGLAALAGAWLGATSTVAPVLVVVLALVPLALTESLAPLPTAAQHAPALRAAQARVADLPVGADTRPSTVGPAPDLRLDGVDVRWPGAELAALRDVTVAVPRGAHVAVVGPSGAGKSTLLALLLGFLDPERGVAQRPCRVAWCPQEPQLVSTTVRENLRLARPDASDAELADCLRAACLDGWVDRLDVPLGAGGSGTSGGEAQRLALARALLAADDADLVLLDEPTAHLDVPTATKLLAGLRDRLAGRTVVHVTHRPEEAGAADLVLRVADGRILVT